MGTLIAWVLVRDRFRGQSIVNAIIDLPVRAARRSSPGLTLLALYGPNGPFGVDIAFSRTAVAMALLFVTLPFVIRTVQPVLLEARPRDGGGRRVARCRPVPDLQARRLPELFPAVLSGVALAFARAIGEFGSVVLITGNLPFKTEVASVLHLRADRERRSGERGGGLGAPARRLLRRPAGDRRPAPSRDEARPCSVGTGSASRR
jgi:sulfate transport system permease protein